MDFSASRQTERLRDAGLDEGCCSMVADFGQKGPYQNLLRRLYGPVFEKTMQCLQELSCSPEYNEERKEEMQSEADRLKTMLGPRGFVLTSPKGICSGKQPKY